MTKNHWLLGATLVPFFFAGCHSASPPATPDDPPEPAAAEVAETISPPGAEQENEVHIVALENGSAEEIANTLHQLAARRSSGAVILSGDVNIVPHHATNSLVIVSTSEDFQQLQEVIETLDVPTIWRNRMTRAQRSDEIE